MSDFSRLLVGNYSIGWDDWVISWSDDGDAGAMCDGIDMPMAEAFKALTAHQQSKPARSSVIVNGRYVTDGHPSLFEADARAVAHALASGDS